MRFIHLAVFFAVGPILGHYITAKTTGYGVGFDILIYKPIPYFYIAFVFLCFALYFYKNTL